MDALIRHRQQDLSGTAQFLEAGEYCAYHFLNPQIWIEHDPGVPVPKVANRRGVTQFTASRLRPRGVQHPRSQYPQFKLADAALHA